MSLAIDNANVVADDSSFTSTSTTTSVTVGASDNLLVVFVGNAYNSGNSVPPDGFTYNSVSLTLLGNVGHNGAPTTSVWYLSAPPTGTHNLVGSWTTNTSGGACCVTAVPMSGAATSSIFGTVATAFSTANNNPAITATGGSTGSIYLAGTINLITTTTSTGSGQTDVANTGSIGGGANNSFDVSTIAGSGSGAFTWTGSGTVNVAQWGALGVNVNAPPPAIADGTTTSGTSVATGTGGAALPAITTGQLLDVLICAQTSSALTDTTPTDNTSGAISWHHSRTYDDHANGYIFERWYGIVVSGYATPVVTSTWSGSAKLSIAVGIQNGVITGNAWSPNSWSQASQSGTSGANSQSSGVLVGNTLFSAILCGWGFNTGQNGAPTAGTSPLTFTSIGTAWGGLGSACLTYESAPIGVNTNFAATFNPFSTTHSYTFAQAYNLQGIPGGPMPRLLYVMP